jgi:hypothetical protein
MSNNSISAKTEALLSSMFSTNKKNERFYSQPYSYHPGIEGNRFSPNYYPDPTSIKYGIDMGDKSLFWDNPDVVTMGCSFTQMGDLPYSFNWPKIIEHTQGLKVNNCGLCGSGVNLEIAFAMDVMKKFGFPSTIYALFPNMERAFMPHEIDEKNENISLSAIEWHSSIGVYAQNSAPYYPREKSNKAKEFVITENGNKHYVSSVPIVFQSLLLIEIFEGMCDAAGIDFKFSSWFPRSITTFKDLEFSSYIKPYDFGSMNISSSDFSKKWEDDVINDSQLFSLNNFESHELGIDGPIRPWQMFGVHDGVLQCDHEPQTEMQDLFWVRAADGMHVGFHDQIHFAEHFIQKRISNSEIKEIPEIRIRLGKQ